jgi:hypothetical protein
VQAQPGHDRRRPRDHFLQIRKSEKVILERADGPFASLSRF